MRKLIILFLILLLPSLSWATTYYVDSSITDVHVASATPDYTTYNPTTFATDTGSDSVYKTIADINAKTFSGGDSILFRKGQTWRENQITPTASSIIYGSFGTGNKPQILCSDQISTWGVYSGNVWSSSHTGAVTQLWFKNASDGKILWGNLKANAAACTAEYDWYYASNVIYCYAATDPDSRYTWVEGAVSGRIGFLHNSKTNVIIQDLEIAYGDHEAIKFGNTASTGWTVQRCELHHFGTTPLGGNSNTGVCIAGSYGSTISANTIYECGESAFMAYAYTNADFGGHTIDGNTIYNVYYAALNFPTDSGYSNNNIIRYNTLYCDSDFASSQMIGGQESEAIYLGAGSSIANVQIYYNTIRTWYGVSMKVGSPASNPKIYNNTIYGTHASYVGSNGIGLYIGAVTGALIKNNISYKASYSSLYIDSTSVVSSCDYNLWYNDGGRFADVNGTGYTNFSTYKSATGFDTHGFSQDPLMTSPATGDFTLQSGSPCIDQGIDVGLPYSGEAPDLGAYEYEEVVPKLQGVTIIGGTIK